MNRATVNKIFQKHPVYVKAGMIAVISIIIFGCVYSKDNGKKLEKDEKISLIRILSNELTIDNKKCTVSYAINIYTKSIFEAIRESDVSLIKFYKDEL